MAMQRWGIYISRGACDGEPSVFNEPAIFLIRPDGILHGAIVNSAPFSRPHVDDLLSSIKYILQHNYPIRGAEA